ncbi:DHH family phosphoesterase [Candidatus Saccharibacteria bacterium]|nr:DHH family phosphoesterase [Candidatus Saccharibacteria bacterium]
MNSNYPQYDQADTIQKIINESEHIVVIQADNPDADSLASALALEDILENAGKKVTLYCGIDISQYLHYIPGTDRVVKDLPNNFDSAILVDCSSINLLEQLEKTNSIGALRTRPFIILDHHEIDNTITINNTAIIDSDAVATGELIYLLAQHLNWQISESAASLLTTSILADSLGFSTEKTSARPLRVVADLIDRGANLAKLDEIRRRSMSKPIDIITYKGKLLQRIDYFLDNQLAMIDIPWEETQRFSPHYNPAVLVLEELRFAREIKLGIVLKTYPDGRITGKLRSNYGSTIAGKLAEHFGGGGHPSASGFKTKDYNLENIKKEIIKVANQLIIEESKV